MFKDLLAQIKKYRFAYWFVLPTFLAMVSLHIFPVVQAFYMSFLDLNQFTISQYLLAPFVGFKNYVDILFNMNSPIHIGLFESIRNTVIYTVVVTVGTIGVGMLVALMVNRKFRGKNIVRALYLFPWVVPTYVVGLCVHVAKGDRYHQHVPGGLAAYTAGQAVLAFGLQYIMGDNDPYHLEVWAAFPADAPCRDAVDTG